VAETLLGEQRLQAPATVVGNVRTRRCGHRSRSSLWRPWRVTGAWEIRQQLQSATNSTGLHAD